MNRIKNKLNRMAGVKEELAPEMLDRLIIIAHLSFLESWINEGKPNISYCIDELSKEDTGLDSSELEELAKEIYPTHRNDLAPGIECELEEFLTGLYKKML